MFARGNPHLAAASTVSRKPQQQGTRTGRARVLGRGLWVHEALQVSPSRAQLGSGACRVPCGIEVPNAKAAATLRITP